MKISANRGKPFWRNLQFNIENGIFRGTSKISNLQLFVSQQILMKFGTKSFFDLLKLNIKSVFRNSEMGPPMGGGMGQIAEILSFQQNLIKFGTR